MYVHCAQLACQCGMPLYLGQPSRARDGVRLAAVLSSQTVFASAAAGKEVSSLALGGPVGKKDKVRALAAHHRMTVAGVCSTPCHACVRVCVWNRYLWQWPNKSRV